MENLSLLCCHDFLLVGTRSECDRFSCQEGNQFFLICTFIRAIMSISNA